MDRAVGVETSYNENLTDECQKQRRSTCCIPKRYLVAVLGFLGIANIALRVNLSVTLVAMVSNQTKLNKDGVRTLLIPAEFDWDTKLQGVILSSFYYGYIFTQIPGGYLSTKYGGKSFFGGGLLITGVIALLIPFATRLHVSLLIVLRMHEGFFAGVAVPSMHAIWRKWAPPLERGELVATSMSGKIVGSILSMSFSGLLADSYGWRSVFYVYGSITLIWSFFWFWLVSDSPQDHPTISQEELDYINESLADDQSETKIQSTPWKEISTSLPFLAILVAHTTSNWAYYTLLTSLPTYFKTVLHFNLKQVGFLSAMPYFVMVFFLQVGGRLSDVFRKKCLMSTTNVRKLFNSLGFLGPALFMVVVAFTKDKTVAVFALTLAVGSIGLAWSAFMVNHLDIAPRYASLLIGITNSCGTSSGIFSPLLVGYITTHHTQAEWKIVFVIAAGIQVFGMIFYLIFASGDKQPWANHDDYEVLKTDEIEMTDNDEIADGK